MPRLEIASPDDQRVYDILDPFVTIGRASGNHLRLEDASIAPVHLRLVQVPKGYRVELADTEQEMAVNGVHCASHVLAPGDRIQIGDTVLTFVAASAAPVQALPEPRQTPVRKVRPAPEPAAAPASRPARPQHAAAAAPRAAPAQGQGHGHSHGHAHGHHAHGHAHGHEHGSHGHHPHAKKGNPWVMWVSIVVGASVVVAVLLRAMGAGSGLEAMGSPENYLQQAENEYQKGTPAAFEAALKNCQLAALRNPSAAITGRIEELTKKIREKQGRGEDQPTLDLAKKSLTAMEEFEQKYLSGGSNRPAARDISQRAQAWLNNYREVVLRYPDTADSAEKVQALFTKYSRDAHLESPDDSADILFQVERRLALPQPLFREALSTLDAYIQIHPNDSQSAALYAKRTEIVSAARSDFDRHAAEVKAHIAAHRIPEARKELSAMRDAIVARGWDAQADALEREINAAK